MSPEKLSPREQVADSRPPVERNGFAAADPVGPYLCHELASRARKQLAQHSHFRRRAESFEFLKLGDTLVVRGRVPTFYLKQMAQTVLRDLDGVRWIDNQIEVVASGGLSSTRGQ